MTTAALKATAIAARQPKVLSMNAKSQFQVAATISTGGAANGVSVPPIEMLTNSTPTVAYFRREETSRENSVSRSISAASVIAAGSVMNEPSSGTSASRRK